MIRRLTVFAILLFIFIATAAALLSGGYFPVHDDTQEARVFAMGAALRDGQFPVRWVDYLGYGYGYPIFNFYGPLPYYFGGLLFALGIDILAATKLMMAAGLLLAILSMYLLLVRFGRAAALAGAALYALAPYHAVQLYVRGAVGELWAYGFLPLVAVGIFSGSAKDRVIGVIGLAGTILSHTIFGYVVSGVYLLGIIVAAAISLKFKPLVPAAVNLVRQLATALLLTAFFWIPAFSEKDFTLVGSMVWDKTQLADHFVCLSQLWSSTWGFGGSAPGCLDGMSFMVGKLHILLFTIGLGFFLFQKSLRKLPGLLIAAVVLVVISVFMMTSLSGAVWEYIPLSRYVQYPWRLLPFTVFGVSVVAAVLIFRLKPGFIRHAFGLAVIFLAVFLYTKRFTPQYLYDYGVRSQDQTDITYRASKISDEYLPPAVSRPLSPEEIVTEPISLLTGVSLEYDQVRSTYLKAFPEAAAAGGRVRINRAYFPGWIYRVNGQITPPEIVGGLPELALPPGKNVLEAEFTDTTIRKISNIISLVAVLIAAITYGKKAVR